MKANGFLIVCIVFISCNPKTSRTNNGSIKDSCAGGNKIVGDMAKQLLVDTAVIPETHLHDTTVVSGSFIIFLRPDSARFKSYIGDPGSGIYEVDGDFGVGLSNTIDSIAKIKKYESVKTVISTRRFIKIKDCKNSPLIIDRDTVDYGILLSQKGKGIKINTFVHSGDYLKEVNEYFKLNNGR